MNTKLIMTLSAVTMGVSGIILSFFPDELLTGGHTGTTTATLVLQILGALYFAFAMVNWTARANLIGGIYARPIALGNFTHFTIGALALTKGYFAAGDMVMLPVGLVYVVFAVCFSIIFFGIL